VSGPRNVDQFFEEAQRFAILSKDILDIRVAVLGDWHTGGKKGGRIIYDTPSVAACSSGCANCFMMNFLDEDKVEDNDVQLWTSLCVATQQHHDIFPSKQRCLNCKTFEQYQESFIRYTVVECIEKQDLIDEIDLINSFRLLYYNGIKELVQLRRIEDEAKSKIIFEVLARFRSLKEFKRMSIARDHALKIGLMNR